MEDFEGKVDQIKEGADVNNIDESPSWIHDIFNRYSEYFTLNDTNVEVEDLEPPMLDETWGLHGSDSVKNSHLIDTVFQNKLNGKLLIIDLVIFVFYEWIWFFGSFNKALKSPNHNNCVSIRYIFI